MENIMSAYRRDEKPYSGKYIENNKSRVQPSYSRMHSIGDSNKQARKNYLTIYLRTKATPYLNNQKENKGKLHDVTVMFMEKSEPGKRLSDFIAVIFVRSIESCDTLAQLKGITEAFEILETYALNLAWYPYKKQFKSIKVKSAFVMMHVEPYIKGCKDIFKKLGYKRSQTCPDELVVEKMPDRSDIMEVAFDCFAAHKESEMYVIIFGDLENQGYSVNDVHRCRLDFQGDKKECIKWIVQNSTPKATRSKSTHELIDQRLKEGTSVDLIGNYSTVSRTPVLDERASERLRMYQEEASLAPEKVNKIGSYEKRMGPSVPPRVSSSPVSPPPLGGLHTKYSDQRSNYFKEGTLDEHVTESLREVEQSDSVSTPIITKPPSRDEWSAVYKTVENLGKEYYDPGGRGDILKGDKMVPKEEEEEEEEFPPPPSERELARMRDPVSRTNKASKLSPYNVAKYGPSLPTSGYMKATPSRTSGFDETTASRTSGFNDTTTSRTSGLPRVDPTRSRTSGFIDTTLSRTSEFVDPTSGISGHVQPSRASGYVPSTASYTSGNYAKQENISATTNISRLIHDSSLPSQALTSGYLSNLAQQPGFSETDNPSDLYSPTMSSGPKRSSNLQGKTTDLSSQSSQLSVDASSLKSGTRSRDYPSAVKIVKSPILSQNTQFSTFGGKASAQQDPYQSRGLVNDDADYVQLKQVSPPGKPSYAANFQDTTQRLYQAPSNTSLARSGYGSEASQRNVQTNGSRAASGISQSNIQNKRQWQCPKCTYINESYGNICSICNN